MDYLILNNINDELIRGEDCKYEDSFLTIEQEVDNDKSVTQENKTDWNFVIKKSEEFLINESKDLKIASWLLYANWKNNSWNGLNTSLKVYIELLEKFNLNMFPSSIKAKKNVFIWLEIELSDIIINKKDEIIHGDELYESFVKLSEIIKTKFEIDEKFFLKVIRTLEEFKKVEVVEVKVTSETKKSESSPSTQSKSTSNNLASEINNDEDALNVLRDFKKYASLLTEYYREKDFSDYKALRINRLVSWLDVEGLPFNNANITFVQPPSVIELDEMKAYINNSEYKQAFSLIEEIIEVSPYWLDGHYEAFKVLEKTANFELANEVKNNLIAFVTTNTGILNMKFADESAFANIKTKEWIQENLNEGSSSGTTSNENEDDVFSVAYELANQNKLNDAFNLLENKMQSSQNEEKKFIWRLNKVKLALEFDKNDIALALLEELENDINKYNLKQWNPKISSEVYELMLTSFTNMDIDVEKRSELYKSLCTTDICKALEIKI